MQTRLKLIVCFSVITVSLFITLSGCNFWDGGKTDVVIDIDLKQQGKEMSPDIYGLYFGKTDHKTDSGLVAKLIEKQEVEGGNVAEDMKSNNRTGGLKEDLRRMLAGLKPTYMQFPEGCIVEGATLQSRFKWYISNDANADHGFDSDNRCKVYMDAFAVTKGKPGSGSLKAALDKAALMIRKESNTDVALASQEATLENINDNKWNPDMIIYNNNQAYGTPSYYAFRMFTENRPDKVMPTKLTLTETGNPGFKAKSKLNNGLTHNDTLKKQTLPFIYATAGMQTKSGLVIIKIVNSYHTSKVCKFVLNYAEQIKYKGEAYVMTSENISDENAFKYPEKIVPMTKELKGLKNTFKYECPANAIVIIKLRYKKGITGNGYCC